MPKSIRVQAHAQVALLSAGPLALNACAQPLAPDNVVTKVIDAPVADVWEAWATTDGIERFFAPIPVIRGLRTLVYLDVRPLPDNRTELTLRNFGYGEGEEWAKSKAFFSQARPNVRAILDKRFLPK